MKSNLKLDVNKQKAPWLDQYIYMYYLDVTQVNVVLESKLLISFL